MKHRTSTAPCSPYARPALARALSALLLVPALALAQAPSENGAITNSTLKQNQDVINAQGVGTVITFMDKGASHCDENGENCRSLFGDDDSLDFGSVSSLSQSALGGNAFGFMGLNGDANNVSSQTGSVVLVCGDPKPRTIAGIAIKATECSVSGDGNANLTVQVCTAPSRGHPVVPPEDAVPCSDNPNAPNYLPPAGSVCLRKSCDTEPEGSQDGWSVPHQIKWSSGLPATATDNERTQNGLELFFYPDLVAGALPSFSADSETMTAVKVVSTFIHENTGQQAVGMKVAYRYKMQLDRQKMIDGASSVPNPGAHTAQWENLQRMELNPMRSAIEMPMAGQLAAGMEAVNTGLDKDGEVKVFDPNYVGQESGLRPNALSAKIAGSNQDCGSVAECIKEVVNTNTWTQTCQADVPLSIRNCSTQTDYTLEDIHSKRTRSFDMCEEKRLTAVHTCEVQAEPMHCSHGSIFNQGGIDLNSLSSDTRVQEVSRSADGKTREFLFGTVGDNYWRTAYYKREFDVTVYDHATIDKFELYALGFDDHIYIAINGTWVYTHASPGAKYNPETDKWGWERHISCAPRGGFGDGPGRRDPRCKPERKWVAYPWGGGWYQDVYPPYVIGWIYLIERSTNWRFNINPIDLRPYLKEGKNTIRIDTSVVDRGEGWAYFRIAGWSAKCDYNIQNECAVYEAAAQ